MALINKELLVSTIKWTPLLQSLLKLCSGMTLVTVNFGILIDIFGEFAIRNLDFCRVYQATDHILKMAVANDTEINASFGYGVNYVASTCHHNHYLDLEYFKDKSWNLFYLWICCSDSFESRKRQICWILDRRWDLALTHDFSLNFQDKRLKCPNRRNGRADWQGTKRMWIDHLTFCVTTERWVSVNRGDFRR